MIELGTNFEIIEKKTKVEKFLEYES